MQKKLLIPILVVMVLVIVLMVRGCGNKDASQAVSYTHLHICAEVARLVRLDKFAVAVVDHDDDVGAQLFAERDGLADGIDRDRRARAVALGALDVDELRLIVQLSLIHI